MRSAQEVLDDFYPAVMTADEMYAMYEGMPVFLETREACWPNNMHIHEYVLSDGCQSITETVTQEKDDLFFFKALRKSILPMRFSTYGVEWRCWKSQPEKHDMEAERWDG